MTARLTSQMLVSALLRRTQAEGGMATILHKGESISGTIVVQLLERGANRGFFERLTNLSGTLELVPCGPQETDQQYEIMAYISRRVDVDPDIWLVELDIASGHHLAAQVLCQS